MNMVYLYLRLAAKMYLAGGGVGWLCPGGLTKRAEGKWRMEGGKGTFIQQ